MADDESPAAYKVSEHDGRRLAELAHVPETSLVRFCDLLAWAIMQGSLGTPYAREISQAPNIADPLNRVTGAAQELDQALGALFGEGDTFGKPTFLTCGLLETAIDDAITGEGDITVGYPRLTAYRRWLMTLIAATEEARKRADNTFPTKRGPGRPRGAGGNLFFNNFVKNLHEIARMTGGGWTHGRDRNSTDKIKWNGTLMQALEILRPYLPDKGFFPSADLGRSVEHALGQLKTDTTNISSFG